MSNQFNKNQGYKAPKDYGFDSTNNIYPYNFVSLLKEANRKERTKGNLTGYIDISLTPKTDLIIPFEKANDGSYVFFKNENNYVIPGSQIRGVVRSTYEALTNSCLSQMDEDYNVSFRYPVFEGNNWKSCVIEYIDNKWSIYDANKYKFNSDYSLNSKEFRKKMTSKSFYCKNLNRSFNFKESENFIPVDNYILRFGEKTIKNGISIALYEAKNKILSNDQDVVDLLVNNLKKNCETYIDNIINLNTNNKTDSKVNLYNDIIKAIDNKKAFVAFYNDKGYLSPSQIGREMINETLDNMYKGYEACDNLLCPACSLFGTISNSKSLESRVRFTDLLLDKKGIQTKKVELVSLGAHLSNYRFYANKKWDLENVRIRGRKFYWHHNVLKEETNNENSNVTSSFETLVFDTNNDKKFTGRVYFEDLTEEELKDLAFAIELQDDNHMQKIGHGKPFGYGSINCKFEKIYLREINENRIVEKEYDLNKNNWNSYPNSNELEMITRFDVLKNKWNDIKYPSDYGWFSDNYNKRLLLANITDVVNNHKYFKEIEKNANKNKFSYR